MQIKCLHKNFYKLYAYSRTQETLEKYKNLYQGSVSLWEKLKNEGVCVKTCQEVTGVFRATYYRRKRILNRLLRGIAPPSKRPQKLNKPRWREPQKQLVLTIRRANPTYGEEKNRHHLETRPWSSYKREYCGPYPNLLKRTRPDHKVSLRFADQKKKTL